MDNLLLLLICGFGLASYISGIGQVIRGQYRPNLVSRLIWLLLAINSTAGVVFGSHTVGAAALAVIFMAGNAGMFAVSLWKGDRYFGVLEAVCLGLFVLSVGLWVWSPSPIVSLSIGLVGHFVGAIPTLVNAVRRPGSESVLFWSFFFIASVLAVVAGFGRSVETLVFPLYFVAFDGVMVVLAMVPRRR